VLVVYDRDFLGVVARHDAKHALRKNQQAMALGDAAPLAAALMREGFVAAAYAITRDPRSLLEGIARFRPDVVFNLCDTLGGRGDDAALVPALLHASNIPFAGADAAGLALSRRKHDVKAILCRDNLPTPRYEVLRREDGTDFALRIQPPVIVKLSGEHASVGLDQASICFDAREVMERAEFLWRTFDQPLVIEEYVDGREFSVTFVGDPPHALPPMELPFDQLPDGFFRMRGFDTKWLSSPNANRQRPDLERTARPVPIREAATPVRVGLEHLVEAARRAFVAAGCRDWGRVDVRVDRGGIPLIIDVTPNTYLGANAPCVKAANEAGLSLGGFAARVVECVLRRSKSKRRGM